MKGFRYSFLFRSESIAVLLAAAAFVIGFVGWAENYHWQIIDKSPEIVVRLIRLFIPGAANLEEGNSLTRLAAVLGLISAMSGVLIVWFSATGRSIDNGWTRIGRRRHRLILGDTEFARTIQDILKNDHTKTIRVTLTGETIPSRKPIAGVLPIGFDTDVLISKAGALRSSHIVVDAGTDIETLDLARRLITAADAASTALVVSISIRIADSLLGLKFVELIADERRRAARPHRLARLSIFDEHAIAARYLLAHMPLFPRAAARGQARVHALIFGAGDAAEKMLDQVFLTSVAGDLQAPRVTIVHADADRMRHQFAARRPGVLAGLALEFVALDLSEAPLDGPDLSPQSQRLQAIEAECNFTAILLADADDAANLRIALMIAKHQERSGRLKAPILCCLTRETAIATTLFPDHPAPLDAASGCHFINLPTTALSDAALGSSASHALAQDLHDAYRAGSGASASGNQSWDALSETLRQSNMRSTDHMPAMMWSAGLTEADGLRPAADRSDRLTRLIELIRAEPGNAEVQRLARIEHDRWCIDRTLDGWRYGAQRDDVRRFHPLMVPFDALQQQPVEVTKDIDRIGVLFQHMLRST